MNLSNYKVSVLVIFAMLGACLPCRAAAGDARPVVKLAPFRVIAGQAELAFTCEEDTRRIVEIKISGVTRGSSFEKAGVRVGDCITMVNGVSVVGMNYAEWMTPDGILAKQISELTFTGRRGLFNRRRVEFTAGVVPPPEKRPNKAPEPTPVPVTPRATEGDSK